MDEIVKAALAKWPNVPHCHGWLALDARGDWYMRDDACQLAGPFPHPKGSLVRHEKLRDFIHRNYLPDAQGAWFFQNGPQRVYVTLEATPLVLRLQDDGRVLDHTGEALIPSACVLDEDGWLYLLTPKGLGLVHGHDLVLATEHLESGEWIAQNMLRAELPTRFGFQQVPQA
jgi:Protein of unknown function (DUF2946)